MSERKLLPCPFCGGEVKLDEDEFYMFCCDKCGAGITFAKQLEDGMATDCNKDESIDKWNTRKPIEKVVDQLESLEPFHVDGYGDVMVNLDDVIEIVKQGGVGTDE